MSPIGNRRTGAARRFARYCLVGGVGTAVHFGITIALVEAFGVDPVAASVAGFVGALAVSFVLNRQWVFVSRMPIVRGLARYLVVSGFGFLLNVAIMTLVTRGLAWNYAYGLALVVLVIPATNFALNAWWTFRGPADDGSVR